MAPLDLAIREDFIKYRISPSFPLSESIRIVNFNKININTKDYQDERQRE